MKTRFILFISMITLSVNAYSQNMVTVKQSFSGNNANNSGISIININTDFPVEIISGVEDAVYLTGEIKDSTDYKPFCFMDNNELVINSPCENRKDCKIKIELKHNVFTYKIGDKSNVIVKDNINFGNNLYILAGKESIIVFEGKVKLETLNIDAKEYSRVRFNILDISTIANINAKRGAIIDFNGGYIKEIVMEEESDTSLTGDFFDEKYKNGLVTTITHSSPTKNIVLEQLENWKDKMEEKQNNNEGVDFKMNFGYGCLGWTSGVSNIDDLFENPMGVYDLKTTSGSSWTLGFKLVIPMSKRFDFLIGLGYESDIFRFRNNVNLVEINSQKQIGYENDPTIEAESKLVARYITLPIFVDWNFYKKLSINVGVIGGLNFNSSSTGFKRDYEIGVSEIEDRWGAKYNNFKPVKLDAQVGIKFNKVNLYLRHSFTPLFKDVKEMVVYPYSVGITLGL